MGDLLCDLAVVTYSAGALPHRPQRCARASLGIARAEWHKQDRLEAMRDAAAA